MKFFDNNRNKYVIIFTIFLIIASTISIYFYKNKNSEVKQIEKVVNSYINSYKNVTNIFDIDLDTLISISTGSVKDKFQNDKKFLDELSVSERRAYLQTVEPKRPQSIIIKDSIKIKDNKATALITDYTNIGPESKPIFKESTSKIELTKSDSNSVWLISGLY